MMVRIYFWTWKDRWGQGTWREHWERTGKKVDQRTLDLMPNLITFTSERTAGSNPSLHNEWMEGKWISGEEWQNKTPICPKVHACLAHMSHGGSLHVFLHMDVQIWEYGCAHMHTHTLHMCAHMPPSFLVLWVCCTATCKSKVMKLIDWETLFFSRYTDMQNL